MLVWLEFGIWAASTTVQERVEFVGGPLNNTSELLNRQDSEIEIVGDPLENKSPSELLKRHPLENSDVEFVGDPLENSSKIHKH
ncbi:hypothetical protein C2G38_2168043 [Gigaspora rosea]|uniref:Uncharacterized protein n=1 Tax=Gigaspora rosea TaxID=44941 RepID=A0A397VUI4_9GLOM|nr:hypothetical protein C2G38_2168043 [Gigaspora rosea]